jgi:YVTN family beta-propeller protein
MKRRINFLTLVIILAIIVSGCKKENIENFNTGFSHGIFITNEGAFGGGNGSLSYFDPDSLKIINNLFGTVNGRSPGDLLQSFGICGDKGFLVVNGSKKVEVVDMLTFMSIGVIENLSYPRYIIEAGLNQAYITNGNMAGTVYVVNTENLTITDSIQVGKGPEKMLKFENNIYVANSGGWIDDNSVSVININTREIIKTIEVGDRPSDMIIDANNNIWVLCRGKQVYNSSWTEIIEETDSKLVVINTNDNTIEKSIVVGQKGDMNPFIRHLSICNNGNTILFDEFDGIYSMEINENIAPTSPLISKIFHGMESDNNDVIYCFQVKDYVTDGTMFRYSVDGILLDSIKVGIGPNGAYFN